MDDLSEDVKKLIRRGYNQMGKELEFPHRNDDFERMRILARKWRNLIGEAKFDIPPCLHRYVNWLMPEYWFEHPKPNRIGCFDFKVEIPGFAAVFIHYKQFAVSDWFFHHFEIFECSTPISSTRYSDLPLFLAIAHELKKPKKHKVQIEEIEGELADNAKSVKTVEVKKGYVFTESDFINNPDCDFDEHRADDDGMPIYA